MTRVVIRPPNWLGDAVLALPAMTAVRRHFSDAHIAVAAAPSVAGVFREDTPVRPDAVIELPASTTDAATALARERFDVGVLLPNSFRSAWQFRRAGIPERWGYARAMRGALLTRRARVPRVRGLHQAEYYRLLVRSLGIACDDAAPTMAASPRSLAAAERELERRGLAVGAAYVALAPGAAYGQAKQWPPVRVAELIARLAAERRVTCVLAGAGHDRPAARDIETWLRAHAPDALPRLVDVVGQTSMAAFIGLAARASVFVSNDSGAMHVAAALGRPVVAIFGSTDERATGPLGAHEVVTADVFCRPCLLRDCPIDHRCMTRIPVARVFDAVSAGLSDVRYNPAVSTAL